MNQLIQRMNPREVPTELAAPVKAGIGGLV